jgi:phosphatidate cytidylyltransferase
VLTCVIAAIAAHEYLTIVGADSSGIGGAVIACWIVGGGSIPDLAAAVLLPMVVAVLLVMMRNTSIAAAAAAGLATVYVGVPLGMLAAVHRAFGSPATLFIIGTIVVSDSAQYYSGRTFGRHPLAPAISPKKTIEGAVGGAIFGTLFVAIVGAYLFGLAPATAVPLGLAAVALGIVGDLFESRLKRAAGVKDSSSLIPGHGGALDRIDALLFAVPAFYLYFSA